MAVVARACQVQARRSHLCVLATRHRYKSTEEPGEVGPVPMLFVQYKPELYFWRVRPRCLLSGQPWLTRNRPPAPGCPQLVHVGRNLMLAAIMVVTPYYDPSITYGLMVLVLQASAALDHYFHPFALTRDNRLQVGATYCLMIACLAGLVASSARHRSDDVAKAAIIICMVVNIFLIAGIVITFIHAVGKVAYRRFLSVRAEAVSRGYVPNAMCAASSQPPTPPPLTLSSPSLLFAVASRVCTRFVQRNCFCTRDGCRLLARYLGCSCCAWRPRRALLSPVLRLPDKSTTRALLSDDRLVRVSTSGRVLSEGGGGGGEGVTERDAAAQLPQSSADSGLRWEDVHVYHASPTVSAGGGGVARRESQRHSTRGTMRVSDADVGALNVSDDDDEALDTWRDSMAATASTCVGAVLRLAAPWLH